MRTDPELRRLALASLLLAFRGPEPPRWLAAALDAGLGGIVLFASNVAGAGTDVTRLTDQLREWAGREIVVALDEEGGDVTRLDARCGSASPGAAALGFRDDPAVTRDVHAALGARLAAAGVTLDLAPVADVNVDPANPVIGVRSFGAEPSLVARHVAAAVDGLQSAGVAGCVKHFPGHGATTVDSHHAVATVPHGRPELESIDLVPFRVAIAAGVRAVMTGHLLVPALDDRIATISRRITTDLLRADLGFTGTVITDALEMRAVAGTIGVVDGFVHAVDAGADTVETGAGEYPELVAAIPAAVTDAVRSGRLSAERLADAAEWTARLATRPRAPIVPDAAAVGGARVEVDGVLPRLRRPLVVECRPPDTMASGALPWTVGGRLAQLVADVEVRLVDGPSTLAALSADGGRSLVVVVRDAHRHEWQRTAMQLAARRPGSVVVDVGWPVDDGPGVPTVRTRGVAPALLDEAARLLATGGTR